MTEPTINRSLQRRTLAFPVVGGCLFLVLFARLCYVQVLNPKTSLERPPASVARSLEARPSLAERAWRKVRRELRSLVRAGGGS